LPRGRTGTACVTLRPSRVGPRRCPKFGPVYIALATQQRLDAVVLAGEQPFLGVTNQFTQNRLGFGRNGKAKRNPQPEDPVAQPSQFIRKVHGTAP
jgi:hypothetical protein